MQYFNYFSDRERSSIKKFEQLRTNILSPLCGFLDRLGVKPDHVSFTGVLFLIPVIVFFSSRPVFVIVSLLLYVCMDGLDGSLARRTGTASQAGALLDIVCDQLGMVVVTTLYAAHGVVEGWIGCCYITAYLCMIVFSVAQNHLGIPMQVIFRSKYLCYALYIVVAFTPWSGAAQPVLTLFSIMHALSALQSFHHIRRYYQIMDKKE